MYFDTDSVIYLSDLTDNTRYEVPTGSFLGDMTDELRDYGEGAYINDYVSGGPKNYGFEVITASDEKIYTTKVRGITLSQYTSKRVNFKSMCQMVDQFVKKDEQDELNIVTMRIDRKPKTHQVITRNVVKKFRIVYDKRILRRNYTTVPYGW